jgi:hypothetical protein
VGLRAEVVAQAHLVKEMLVVLLLDMVVEVAVLAQ